jgi:hypothetical protein
MLIPLPPKSHRRSPAKPRVKPAPAPPLGDKIVSVSFGPGADQLTVDLSSVLVSVADPSLGMWVFFNDADPALAIGAIVSDSPPQVVFKFAVDVDSGIAWHVEDPGVWEWQDGGAMNEPFGGPLS